MWPPVDDPMEELTELVWPSSELPALEVQFRVAEVCTSKCLCSFLRYYACYFCNEANQCSFVGREDTVNSNRFFRPLPSGRRLYVFVSQLLSLSRNAFDAGLLVQLFRATGMGKADNQ